MFRKDKRASVAVLAALMTPIAVGAAGFAVDMASVYNIQSRIKDTLDAAVIAAVSEYWNHKDMAGRTGFPTADDYIKTAYSNMKARSGEFNEISYSFTYEDDILHGKAEYIHSTYFGGLVNIPSVGIEVKSGATSKWGRAPLCFMAMHPTRKHTLELKDKVVVRAPDCHIYGNSSHYDDVVDPHTPDNYIYAASVQAVGYGHHYIQNVFPPLEHAPEKIPDPLAKLLMPSPGACSYTNKSVYGGKSILYPGHYCGGLKILSGADVQLAPGQYFISSGDFSVTDSNIQGNDVTIFLLDKNTSINWTKSRVSIRAANSGTYKGIAVFGERIENNHAINRTFVDIHGVIYIVNGTFVWTNEGSEKGKADWTAWIIDGVTWRGDGTIYINFEYKKSSLTYPSALFVIPRPSSPRLVY